MFPTKLKLFFPRGRKPRGVKAPPSAEFFAENVPRMQFIPHPDLVAFPLLAHGSPPPPLLAHIHPKVQPPHFHRFRKKRIQRRCAIRTAGSLV